MGVMRISSGKGNWETIAFVLINETLSAGKIQFSRSQLMSASNLTRAVKISTLFQHKKRPEQPEATLQRTIQNLRDKGFLESLGKGSGEYRVTTAGIDRMKAECDHFYAFMESIANFKEAVKNEGLV